jgi:hypothetical protein
MKSARDEASIFQTQRVVGGHVRIDHVAHPHR